MLVRLVWDRSFARSPRNIWDTGGFASTDRFRSLGGVSGEGFKIIFVPLAIWSSHLSHKLLKRDDPSEVVIDEVAGILWTFFLLPLSWLTLCVGFILFRIFDIFKPFPIRTLERRLRGGIGIVLDDLLAGIYANLCLRIFLLFFK